MIESNRLLIMNRTNRRTIVDNSNLFNRTKILWELKNTYILHMFFFLLMCACSFVIHFSWIFFGKLIYFWADILDVQWWCGPEPNISIKKTSENSQNYKNQQKESDFSFPRKANFFFVAYYEQHSSRHVICIINPFPSDQFLRKPNDFTILLT